MDFLRVIEFKMYVDNVEENIAYNRSYTRPPDYVVLTPSLFNLWSSWADIQEQEKMNLDQIQSELPRGGDITPMGTRICPHWVKFKFDNLEQFYSYYKELLGE